MLRFFRLHRNATRLLYLDHNATTELFPEALAAIKVALGPGNASALHAAARRQRRLLEDCADELRTLLDAASAHIVWTSGGTEADNLAVLGISQWRRRTMGARRVLVGATEHPAVWECTHALQREGFVVETLPVEPTGALELAALEHTISEDTALVAVMLANNETGVLHPVRQVAQACARHGVPVFTDAVQAIGKMPVRFSELGVAALSLTGHKFGGPRGVGALLLRPDVDVEPLWGGGGQQDGRRSGSLPVPLAMGLVAALRRACTGAFADVARLRDALEHGLVQQGAVIVGADAPRLPNTVAARFPRRILEQIDALGLCVSAGAACHDGAPGLSRTYQAMGQSAVESACVVRFSLGWTNTPADIATASGLIAQAIAS